MASASLTIEEIKGDRQSILMVDGMAEQWEIASNLLKALNYNVESISDGNNRFGRKKELEKQVLPHLLCLIAFPINAPAVFAPISALIPYPNFSQNQGHGTEFGKAILKKVKSDKRGKKIPIGMNPGAKRKTDYNKEPRNHMNPVIYIHSSPP